MFRRKFRFVWLLAFLISGLVSGLPTFAQGTEPKQPVVHAVLFYSPTCPHCHEAINNVIVPLMETYGEQLAVLGIDTSTEAGGMLFMNAITYYDIPENRRGVPTLIFDDTVLVSTMEIDNEFQALIDASLAAGGNDWPQLPGLAEIVAEQTPAPQPTETIVAEAQTAVPLPTATLAPQATQTPFSVAQALENIDTSSMATVENEPPPDPVGFALGWLVLLGLVVVLVFAMWRLGGNWTAVTQATTSLADSRNRSLLFWGLVVVGLVVSGYLAYVETTQVTAVCGPIGECNLVQSSPYAQIAGIPIAVLGVLFYLSTIALWLLQRVDSARRWALWALVALTIFGTLFSLYLTLVELLVIGAICMWCLTSAMVTGLMTVLVTTGINQSQISCPPTRPSAINPH